jgi:hypothetical protein
MGCYDSFFLSEPMACPICGDVVGIGTEFQTKDFGENLQSFRIGEVVIFNGVLLLIDGSYSVYGDCRKCHAWIDAQVVIDGHKFIGLVDVRAKSMREKRAEGGNHGD